MPKFVGVERSVSRDATRSHSRRQRLDKLAGCLVVAVVAHLIFFVSCRVFALTRLVAVVSALALALILGHCSSQTYQTGSL